MNTFSVRALRLAASFLAVAATVAAERPGAPVLPERTDPASLRASLDDRARADVDEGQRVATFAPVQYLADNLEVRQSVSLGALRLPPDAVRSLLGQLSRYPEWVALDPLAKQVRVEGSSRFVREVGNVESPSPQRSETYEVAHVGTATTWKLASASGSLAAGSSLVFEVAPHPTVPDASLVVQRRSDHIASSARSPTLDQWGRDAARAARRLHWAIDAALRYPPGPERRGLYVEHYQRELGGRVPAWLGR